MIHVILPAHLRTLAHVDDEVTLEVEGQVTQRSAETIANAGWRTGDWVNGLLQRGRQP